MSMRIVQVMLCALFVMMFAACSDRPVSIQALKARPGGAADTDTSRFPFFFDERFEESAVAGVPSIRFVRKAKTGSLPKGVAVSPEGSTLFVTNFGRVKSWNMFVFNAATLERADTIAFDGNGVEMAFIPGSGRLLVSNFRMHKVQEIDTETLETVRSWPVGKNPKTIAVSADGKRAYVSNWTSDNITALDLVSGKVVGSVYTGNQPRGIAVSPDGRTLYVSNCAGGSLVRVDAEKLEITGTLTFSKRKPTGPRHVALSPDGQRIYVTIQKLASLFVVDAGAMKVVGKARTGAGPKTVDITPDGRFGFTANFSMSSVTAVNLATMESRTFPQPALKRACGLDISPDGSKLYVTGWKAGLLAEYAITYPDNAM